MSTDRKSFIRNSLLALAATFLPEILRPMEGVVKEDRIKREYGEVRKLYLQDEWGQYGKLDKNANWVNIEWDIPPEVKKVVQRLINTKK